MRPSISTRHPAGKLLLALVCTIQINQLFSRNRTIFKCDALRMINLDAPQMALQGDTIRLTCSFSLTDAQTGGPGREEMDGENYLVSELASSGSVGGSVSKRSRRANSERFAAPNQSSDQLGSNRADKQTRYDGDDLFERRSEHQRRRQPRLKDDSNSAAPELLYAIKWYKDEREFYQFVTKNWPHKRALPTAGLNIDVDKSDNQTVVLKHVTLKTSGLFRCEVSTDAPSFVTKSIERKIFIYSLPADGPMIETNLPRLRPNHVNIYLDDRLEFRCMSRESKPNTELDWIINDTLNLTASNPTGANSSPLFNVKTRHFIRLPKIAINSARTFSQPTTMVVNNQANLVNAVVQFYSPQQQTINETTYELVGTSGRTLAKPIDSLESTSVVPLSVDSLDQYLETSLTVLNFTVDTNLVQYFQTYALRETSIRSHEEKRPAQRTTRGSLASRASPGVSFKTKKINADQRRSKSNGQSDSGPSLLLDIRCVARVMHLSMSDEIRLRVVNKTKVAFSKAVSPVEMQRQEKMVQSNSECRF